jgi:hypothetical protein
MRRLSPVDAAFAGNFETGAEGAKGWFFNTTKFFLIFWYG